MIARPRDVMSASAETVIVGAGPAGLAVGACLREAGVPFTILERAGTVGASWRSHYERLHLHTDRDHSTLPGMGFPPGTPTYPSRQQVVDYLEAYAQRFDLRPRLGDPVVRIGRHADGWQVRLDSGARLPAGNVVVATGYNGMPNRPRFPGEEVFGGEVIHSSRYRNGAPWKGRSVLVVGFGNSGGEIAIDLAEHGARPTLAVRSPVNVMPREVFGIPNLTLGIAMNRLPTWLADLLAGPSVRLLVGNLAELGLRKLPYGPIRQIREHGRIPLIDVGTVALIRAGKIAVRPGVERFLPGAAVFAGGRSEPFDAVVLATGFRPRLDRLLAANGTQRLFDEAGTPVRSGAEILPGLWACGFRVSPTGMLREIALEARRIAAGIAGGRRTA
jgi:cation diffusion facilitator CzcD-associated flavoprotein CzcO